MVYNKIVTAKITKDMHDFLIEVAKNTGSTKSHIMRNILVTYLDLYNQDPIQLLLILGADYEEKNIYNKYVTIKITEKMNDFLVFVAEKNTINKSEIIRNILITYIDLYRQHSTEILNILRNNKNKKQ